MNKEEQQYLNILRKIIISNAYQEDIADIVEKLDNEEITLKVAYEEVLKRSNNNLANIMDNNRIIHDRTNTGTYKIFGEMMTFDLSKSFPLITTKRIYTKSVFEELFWFIKGDTNIKTLVDKNVPIWNKNAYEKNYHHIDFPDQKQEEIMISIYDNRINEYAKKIKEDTDFAKKYGDLGPVYGGQWRNFGGHHHAEVEGIDQLKNLVNSIKNNPNSRRHLLFGYNPQEVDQQALPACHVLAQFNVDQGKLSCIMFQRSADMFLGVPFNIASYGLLTHLIADVCNLKVDKLVHVLGDTHIYKDHLEQVQLQLSREPYPFGKLTLNNQTNEELTVEEAIKKLEETKKEDINIENYQYHKSIKGRMS